MHSLTMVEGPGSPQSFVLEHRVTTVGRSPSNDIVLEGAKVSKRHALLSIRDGEHVFVEDLQSRNGVYIDEQKITEQQLSPGMTLRIGECRLLYEKSSYPTESSSYKLTDVGVGFRLLLTDGEGLLKALPIRTDCLYLGKSGDNDVVLSNAEVSRRHAMLCYQDGKWEIHDLESTNGTYIEGNAIEQAVIEPGDRIRIGSYLLAVENAESPISREQLESEAAELLRQQTSYLPWTVQVALLGFILLFAAVIVGIVLLKLFGAA